MKVIVLGYECRVRFANEVRILGTSKEYCIDKHAKTDSLRTLQLFSAKNRSKKHQISEKSDNFEKRPSCKGYSPCKGSSLGKMLSLGQKLKMLKRYEKRFFKNVAVVLCKKPLEKTPNIREMNQF